MEKLKLLKLSVRLLRPYIEKLVTMLKLIQFKIEELVLSKLDNKAAMNKLFAEVAPKFKERNGGYTRIVKLADGRVGDASKMGYISFVE
jgi:large subunit ribosomal protein L17